MHLRSFATRLGHWKKPLLSFAIGQPTVQVLNLLTGFFLLRWLDVKEFAMFGMAFAFQSMVTQLSDLGFSGSIIALAGEQARDPSVLGGYLRSARHWRSKIQSVVLLLSAIVFPLITWGQNWGGGTKVLLFGTIALGVIFQGWSMYGAPLLVHRALSAYYRPQIWSATFRFLLCAGMWSFGLLNAWVASLFAALALGYSGVVYRRECAIYVHEPEASEHDKNSAMLRYLAPLMPGVAFTALQGQILIGISSIFGNTRNIAEITALARIGQLFMILSAFNSVLIGPYISRVSLGLLKRRYVQIIGGACFVAGLICAFGFLKPLPLLWLLGENYAGLNAEIGWVVATGCLGYLAGVLYAMHAARRWIYWWSPAVYIPAIILTQAVCMTYMDLSKTFSVILFGVVTMSVSLLVQLSVGIYGFATMKIGEK